VPLLATPDDLCVGLWADANQPSAIRHARLRRNSDVGSDDTFTRLLDPLRDCLTGFGSMVNPERHEGGRPGDQF
jgi:hypothetical protein